MNIAVKYLYAPQVEMYADQRKKKKKKGKKEKRKCETSKKNRLHNQSQL